MAHTTRPLLRHTARHLLVLGCLLGAPLAWSQAAPPQPANAATPTPTPITARPNMIAEIQVVPRPAGTAGDPYKHVDAAIAIIQASGLHYEVHGMGTVVEGPPEQVWPLLQAVHQATLDAGAERTLSVIKVSSGRAPGPTVDELVKKFR